jgi:outer membrane cobalamin receptor
LPGITTVDGRAGNLYIRGGTPDHNLILFDEIPIYHTGHYFGTISPYNPKVVEKMDVYRTGYSPENGGRIGSVVDIKSRTTVADSTECHAAINTLYGSGSITAALGKKVTLQVAGRSSYLS